MTKSEQIIDTYNINPSWSNRRIAQEVGVSRRHVRRTLNHIRNNNPVQKSIPKILLFDIETSPLTCYLWGLYKQRPSYQNVIQDWSLLSWAAKWLFEPEIMSEVVTQKEAINKEDRSIMVGLWKLLDEADIVIGHNSDKFDIRKINVRFLVNGLQPPAQYQTIDTIKVAKRYFAFSSYSLDYLTQYLGLSQKMHTSFNLWKRCVGGDNKALQDMMKYNRQDVVALEELYLKLRPYIKSHPNCALYIDSPDSSLCANCGSDNLKHNGKYYTPAGRFLAFRCEDCGAICRSRYSDLSREEREQLLISVAR